MFLSGSVVLCVCSLLVQQASPDQSESEAGALNGEMLEPPPEDDSPDKTSVRFQFPTGQRVSGYGPASLFGEVAVTAFTYVR